MKAAESGRSRAPLGECSSEKLSAELDLRAFLLNQTALKAFLQCGGYTAYAFFGVFSLDFRPSEMAALFLHIFPENDTWSDGRIP
jgi:hypothetical protein